MFNFIDSFLDNITMYRLVLYELFVLLGVAMIFGFFGMVPYNPLFLGGTAALFVGICYITNKVFSYIFKAPANVESVYITALILALITKPIHSYHDLPFIGWLAVWSMASKYIFAIKKKHVFNPVAIAGVIVSLFLGQSFNWWIGTSWMAPSVFILGFLIIRKIQREDMVYSFFLSSVVTIGACTMLKGSNVFSAMQTIVLNSSLLFFGFVMFTEPLTTPPTKKLQILYGLLAGFLFAPQIHIGPIYSTPELALVTANVFSYFASPKQKLMLTLKEKREAGDSIGEFIFATSEKIHFVPGQYMEWTLQHKNTDSRGNRRYFTLASSPTENFPQLGIKFFPNGSSFKRALKDMHVGDTIVAGQLAGDFTLPKNTKQKIAFFAGGIGITPFRSIIKYCIDTNTPRDIILFYTNKTIGDIRYHDIFTQAESLGIKTRYIVTGQNAEDRNMINGRITQEVIQREIPDYKERLFYLSGSHVSVKSFETLLQELQIPRSHIKKDFFPGLM